MKKILASFLLLFFITGCAVNTTVPLTGTQRYVQADGSYKALLLTVKEGVTRGTIHGASAIRVKQTLTTAKIALDAWALAPESPNMEQRALFALQSAREVLRALTPSQTRGVGPPLSLAGAMA